MYGNQIYCVREMKNGVVTTIEMESLRQNKNKVI